MCLLSPGTTLSTSGKVSRMVLWKIWTAKVCSSQGLMGRGSKASTTLILTLSSAMVLLTVSSTWGVEHRDKMSTRNDAAALRDISRCSAFQKTSVCELPVVAANTDWRCVSVSLLSAGLMLQLRFLIRCTSVSQGTPSASLLRGRCSACCSWKLMHPNNPAKASRERNFQQRLGEGRCFVLTFPSYPGLDRPVRPPKVCKIPRLPQVTDLNAPIPQSHMIHVLFGTKIGEIWIRGTSAAVSAEWILKFTVALAEEGMTFTWKKGRIKV